MKMFYLTLLSCAMSLQAQAADRPKPLMKDFIGLNGHFQFKPELYKQTCRLVRNYHNMNWDVAKPGDPISIPVCGKQVNRATHVYGKWLKHGYEVDLCAQFGGFGESNKDYQDLWRGHERWIYDYGYEMAKYFGPSGKQKLVTSIEIGNEPGNDFSDELYQKLFVQMATGIRKADPKMKIVTATAQSGTADKYSKSLEKTFSSPQMKALYDVVNLHVYAIKPKKEGQSPWDRSYPEDPALDYLKVVDAGIAFRNAQAPGKELWITEFGYDSCTPAAMKKRDGWFKKLNWTGVTDLQQAQYIVRSIFCFAERDVDRAYIYFFNDSDKASVHAASGLTRNFKPKPAFWAVKQLYETLGDHRFKRIVRKQVGDLHAYEFQHVDKKQIVWVLWSPTGNNRKKSVDIRRLPGRLIGAEGMQVTSHGPDEIAVDRLGANGIRLEVTESPLYLTFGPNK
jgi:hypothetical protein